MQWTVDALINVQYVDKDPYRKDTTACLYTRLQQVKTLPKNCPFNQFSLFFLKEQVQIEIRYRELVGKMQVPRIVWSAKRTGDILEIFNHVLQMFSFMLCLTSIWLWRQKYRLLNRIQGSAVWRQIIYKLFGIEIVKKNNNKIK